MIQNFLILVFLEIKRSFREDDGVRAMIRHKVSLLEMKPFTFLKCIAVMIHERLSNLIFTPRDEPVNGPFGSE
jgi:hypothetical protein